MTWTTEPITITLTPEEVDAVMAYHECCSQLAFDCGDLELPDIKATHDAFHDAVISKFALTHDN